MTVALHIAHKVLWVCASSPLKKTMPTLSPPCVGGVEGSRGGLAAIADSHRSVNEPEKEKAFKGKAAATATSTAIASTIETVSATATATHHKR